VSSLPCKIKSGEFSRHLTADFFNSLSHKLPFECFAESMQIRLVRCIGEVQ